MSSGGQKQMLSISRRDKIKEIIAEERSVSAVKLAEQFNVTVETIRRDLRVLEEEGFLKRTYGGAFLEGAQKDAPVDVRQAINSRGKNVIAKKAAEFINSGDLIFIDFSTTASFLTKHIANKEVTVLTNSLYVTNAFSDMPNVELIVIGGSYTKNCNAFLGDAAVETFSKYYVDKVFMSCRYLSIENGLTDYNEKYAAFHRCMLKRGKEIFLLADGTKFDKTSFININNFNGVNTLITDHALSDEWHIFLSRSRINIIECEIGKDQND